MKLSEFYDQLECHDWYYQMSDDHGVWQRGVADHGRLAEIAKESPAHQKLMSDFTEHYYSGESFGKPDVAKPERPTE